MTKDGNWRETTLGEVMTLQRGFDLPEAQREIGPFPIVASTGLVGMHKNAMVKGPGVVIGRSGSLGGGQFIKKDFWPLNTTLWVKDFKNNDPHFCYFLLKSLDLAQFNVGSGVPTLNRNHIHPLKVLVPLAVSEQRRIAHILGTLDDKIENNRKTAKTLEAMAQAIFQSWFVDFDPVRAKMAGESPESICKRLKLTPEILDLFPDRLVDSELGEIPEGWEVSTIDGKATVVDYVANGSFASLKENVTLLDVPDYALYVRSTDFNSGFSGNLRYVNQSAYRFLSKSSLNGNEVIISNVGSVGAVFIPPKWLGIPMTLGSNSIALKTEIQFYFYLYFSSERGQSLIRSITTGSVQMKFNKTSLRAATLLFPTAGLTSEFENVITNLFHSLDNCMAGQRILSLFRDNILPKLISGEIRVSKMEDSFDRYMP